jgi:hypothetical protein
MFSDYTLIDLAKDRRKGYEQRAIKERIYKQIDAAQRAQSAVTKASPHAKPFVFELARGLIGFVFGRGRQSRIREHMGIG